MQNKNNQKFEPYTAFKLLTILNIIKNGKAFVSDIENSDDLNAIVVNCITRDIIRFSRGMLKLNDKQEITAIDNNTLKNYMWNFIEHYGFNYDIIRNDFLQNFDKSQAPKFYPITDYKYVPFVLLEYLKNENFVRDVYVQVLVANNKFSLFSGDNYSLNDLLPFEIIVDISSLLDNLTVNSKKSSSTQNARIKKYSDTQEKIYLYLKKWVKEYNSFGIDYYSLRNYAKKFTSDVTKALCELNKKYMVINNTKEKLIKYDRSLEQYMINKAITI